MQTSDAIHTNIRYKPYKAGNNKTNPNKTYADKPKLLQTKQKTQTDTRTGTRTYTGTDSHESQSL